MQCTRARRVWLQAIELELECWGDVKEIATQKAFIIISIHFKFSLRDAHVAVTLCLKIWVKTKKRSG